ncbi:enoyl-CoA hydratase/isomerase family protein [Tistrella mobilis]|uniref:enoyl-CoA hydratase/isomerase family protein n=1 Tax=Tistrella mobilis TaxID=171437 RepID=UPI003556D99B
MTDIRPLDEARMAEARALYDHLTGNGSRFLRVGDLLTAGAETAPGLLPDAQTLAAEAARPLSAKTGVEMAQALFLQAIFADRARGLHLCHAMQLPRPEAAANAARLARDGLLDLGLVRVERRGRLLVVENRNAGRLNAEDVPTIDALEHAVDAALLDEESTACILRGGVVDHPRYAGRRLAGAGLNLTDLYEGRVPYVMYIEREMGWVAKVFHGLAAPDRLPDELAETREKAWIGVIDGFAIGAATQALLVCDAVVAEAGSWFNVPARKEGLVPGCTNLRLPRIMGDRLARQIIMNGRTIRVDEPEARLLIDRVAEPGGLETAIDEVAADLVDGGVVSIAGNRRAFRVAQEPLDLFRAYLATYTREVAVCHLSPALVANLERHWTGRKARG